MNLLPAWPLHLKSCLPLPLLLALPGLPGKALWALPSDPQGTTQAPAATATNPPNQASSADGATWLARLAPSGQALERALVERLLAEIDLDRRATADLAVAQSRAAALEQRLANAFQNSADAEAGQLWRQAFLLKVELALAAGDSAAAWQAFQSPLRQAGANEAVVSAAASLLSEAAPLAVKERARLALLNDLGAGSTPGISASDSIESAVEAALADTSLDRIISLGQSAVPHLRSLCAVNRDSFPPKGQWDPLTAYSVVDMLGSLQFLHQEYAGGGVVWRLRMAPILNDYVFGLQQGKLPREQALPLVDDLYLRSLKDPTTSKLQWTFVNDQSRFVQVLPGVSVHLAATVAAAEGSEGLLRMVRGLDFEGHIAEQAQLFCSTRVDELRAAFVQACIGDLWSKDPRARACVLGLAKDPLPQLRRTCAHALVVTESAAERNLRLELLRYDPDPEVRWAAFIALVQEDDRERQSPLSPLGRPFDDPATLALLDRLSQEPSTENAGSWFYACQHLPLAERVIVWYRLLNSGQSQLVETAAQVCKEVDFGSTEETARAWTELWRVAAAYPNLPSSVASDLGLLRFQPEILDALLVNLAKDEDSGPMENLIWVRMSPNSGQSNTDRLTEVATSSGPAGQQAVLTSQALAGASPNRIAILLDRLGPYDGQFLLELANRSKLPPAVSLLVATQALRNDLSAAEVPLLTALAHPDLESDLLEYVKTRKTDWVRQAANDLQRVPEDRLNALALDLLSRTDVGEGAQLFVTSLLSGGGAGSAELARLCVARWGQDLDRKSWELSGLRLALLAVGPDPQFFDQDFVARAMGRPELCSLAVGALGRRRDGAHLPLLGFYLNQFLARSQGQQQGDWNTGYFQGLVNSVAQIGTPAGLALLAETARTSSSHLQRTFILEQIDNLRRLDDARRFAAEQGALPRSRVAATGELLQLLGHSDSNVRLAAIKGLGALGQPEVLPELIALLPGATPEFQTAIQAAIDLMARASVNGFNSATGPTPPLRVSPTPADSPAEGEDQ